MLFRSFLIFRLRRSTAQRYMLYFLHFFLRLPDELVDKVPIDGLTPYTDEENLGFSYAVLDRYIRTGVCDDPEIKEKIDSRHRANLFKMSMMPVYEYRGEIKAE